MTIIKPFIHQAVFMQAPYRFLDVRFFYLIGGYACGKTSGLSYATIEAIRYFSGKRDKEGKRPKIVIAGITLTFLKKTLVGALVSLLQSSKSEFNYDKAHNIIYVGGVEILLVPIENPDEIFGYDVTAILVDELDELPTHISIEVVRSLNDRCRQQIVDCRSPFMMFGTTSQGLKGTYKTVQNFKKIGMNYLIVRGKTKNNTSLPKDYVEAMYRIYNEKEISCLLEGNFVDINAGNVYPDFLEGDHAWHELYQKIEDHETIHIGQDFNGGFNKAVAGVVRDGVIYIIKEYTFPDIRRAPEVFRYDFPKNKILWIPDATNNQHLPSYRKELKAYNIKVVYRKTNPLVKDRTFLINKIFHADRMRVCDNCQNLIQNLMERQNDPKTGLPMKGKGEDAPDHACFEGGTLIATDKGMKRIDKIRVGDNILTRKGYRKCTASSCTGIKEVGLYSFGDSKLVCTSDHPIWTEERGMTPIFELTDKDTYVRLEAWKGKKKSFSMASFTEGILLQVERAIGNTFAVVRRIYHEATGICTAMYGNIPMEKSLKGTVYIISTKIHQTTQSKILSALRKRNTEESITKKTTGRLDFVRLVKQLRLGTQARKEERGIVSMREKISQCMSLVKSLVSNAELFLLETLTSGRMVREDSVLINACQDTDETPVLITRKENVKSAGRASFAINTQDGLRAVKHVPLKPVPVYNITVEGEHEYFANGILVSNCDALEYMVTYIVAWKREMKDIYSITIGRRLEKRAQAFEEGEDQLLHSIQAEEIG